MQVIEAFPAPENVANLQLDAAGNLRQNVE